MAKLLATIALSFMFVFPVFASDDKINVNTAGFEQLDKLYGIGKSKAEAIVQYRLDNPDTDGDGNVFDKPSDLIKVKGIGERTVEKFLDQIVIVVEESKEEVVEEDTPAEEVVPSKADEG